MGTLLKSQEFTTAGAITFNVPTGVTSLWVSMIAGGAGGGGMGLNSGKGAGGGGAGEFCFRVPLKVTSGGTVAGVVGAKGAGGVLDDNSSAGSDGTSTTFGALAVRPGSGRKAGVVFTPGQGGDGGGIKGALGADVLGQAGLEGGYESLHFTGGSAGGAGGNISGILGGAGGQAPGNYGGAAGTGNGAGAGGGGSPWGPGGVGGNGASLHLPGGNAPATSYGSGGGGGGNTSPGTRSTGGDGADGYILVQWAAP